MKQFDYYQPETFEQAFEFLTQPEQNVMVLAGGTDLIPHTRDAVWQPDAVVDIKALPEINKIELKHIEPCCNINPGVCLYIGAAVKMNEIIHSSVVGKHWQVLQQAASAIANEQVRNRATIGGNICTASPAADTAPALLALNAKVLIKSAQGNRCMNIEDFFINPKVNALKTGEIVAGLYIPQPQPGSQGHFEKLSRRKAGDLSVVSVAALAEPENDRYHWRIALGAVAPTPIRAFESETILNTSCDEESIDKASAAAYGCCCPISDIRSSMEYRQLMVINITRQVIRSMLQDIKEG
jgi:carbon-monoxide dehydrogenase medium subunit